MRECIAQSLKATRATSITIDRNPISTRDKTSRLVDILQSLESSPRCKMLKLHHPMRHIRIAVEKESAGMQAHQVISSAGTGCDNHSLLVGSTVMLKAMAIIVDMTMSFSKKLRISPREHVLILHRCWMLLERTLELNTCKLKYQLLKSIS